MSDGMFSLCAEVVEVCQSAAGDLDTLLDPEIGFAPRLQKLCDDQIADIQDDPETNISQDELDALRMESNTWSLLQALLPARKTEPEPRPTAVALLAENPYTPTSTLAQAIMNNSRLLSELVVVREWLHETTSAPQPPEATTGYWKFTKHRLLHGLRTSNKKELDGLVRELDPDAANREDDGRSLSADDTNHEKSLSQALYAYVRAGRLDDAVDLCRKAHQPWRAASIRGSLVFQWRTIANEPRNDDTDEIAFDGWQGNKRRRLWKTTCTRAALNPLLSDPERALYASLAPSPQTSVALKSACRTWEDHLWAQLSVMCEEKQSAEMERLGGGYWEGGVVAVEKGPRIVSDDENEREDAEWMREVVGTLETLANVHVEDGPPADHAFHVSQLHIILNRTDELLKTFSSSLQDGVYDPVSSDYPTMTRFFAHLCLFLQMIDVPVPPLATQTILEAYLQVLEGAGQRELIAMYAGALGENAVERYALFLTSLELSADINERRLALTRAREHGLDMERVAVATAERTIEKAFSILPPLKGPLPSLITLNSGPSDPEWLLIRSIEWTTFMEDTYETALEQANVTLRYLLASGKIQGAKILLGMLPPELGSIRDPEERATEYLHYRQFFNIWEALDRVVECQSLEMSHMNRDTRVAWVGDLKTLVDSAREGVMKLLTSEWLVTDVEENRGGRRRRELIRIRQIVIPELIIRLHAMLLATRNQVEGNLKLALELANVVADSRYRLYEDFVNQDRRRLEDYLGLVRQAILASLELGGSDPFRIITL